MSARLSMGDEAGTMNEGRIANVDSGGPRILKSRLLSLGERWDLSQCRTSKIASTAGS